MTRWLLVLAPMAAALGLVLAEPRGLPGAEDPFRALAMTRLVPPGGPKDFAAPTPPGWAPPGMVPGSSVSLQAYRGQAVFLNFWATWCPPCREEMPAMERIYRRYGPKGLMVLAVSVDGDGERSVPPLLKERSFTFPVALDSGLRVATLYGVRALPSTFLLDRRGRIVSSALGAREWDSPEGYAVIEKLLAEP